MSVSKVVKCQQVAWTKVCSSISPFPIHIRYGEQETLLKPATFIILPFGLWPELVGVARVVIYGRGDPVHLVGIQFEHLTQF